MMRLLSSKTSSERKNKNKKNNPGNDPDLCHHDGLTRAQFVIRKVWVCSGCSCKRGRVHPLNKSASQERRLQTLTFWSLPSVL